MQLAFTKFKILIYFQDDVRELTDPCYQLAGTRRLQIMEWNASVGKNFYHQPGHQSIYSSSPVLWREESRIWNTSSARDQT